MSVAILVGDVLDQLARLPGDHFDVVVTSPPYWGLRDYGVPGQLGLEPTLGEHLAPRMRSWLSAAWLKGLCLLAMALGRSDRDRRGGRCLRHAVQMAWWSPEGRDRPGHWWDLTFDPRALRYGLNRDDAETDW